ncbi:predicted protein, partial [Phaeodactylum tricornutum CCAP 1055/1]
MRSIGLVIWIASSAAFVSASVEVATDGYGRRLIEVESMRKARHEHSPLDKTADKAYSQKKFSALTQSLCRAEADGFFGATFGEPLVFQYGFEMETSKYAQLNVIFDAVSEHVMDSVLSSAFPETCRTEGRNLSPFAGRNGRVTGFYFDQQVLPISSGKQEGECLWFVQPSPTPSLKCPPRSCFVSFDDRATDSMIKQVSGPTAVDTSTQDEMGFSELAPSAKTGVVISTAALMAGLLFLFLLARADQRQCQREVPSKGAVNRPYILSHLYSSSRWFSRSSTQSDRTECMLSNDENTYLEAVANAGLGSTCNGNSYRDLLTPPVEYIEAPRLVCTPGQYTDD